MHLRQPELRSLSVTGTAGPLSATGNRDGAAARPRGRRLPTVTVADAAASLSEPRFESLIACQHCDSGSGFKLAGLSLTDSVISDKATLTNSAVRSGPPGLVRNKKHWSILRSIGLLV